MFYAPTSPREGKHTIFRDTTSPHNVRWFLKKETNSLYLKFREEKIALAEIQ